MRKLCWEKSLDKDVKFFFKENLKEEDKREEIFRYSQFEELNPSFFFK